MKKMIAKKKNVTKLPGLHHQEVSVAHSRNRMGQPDWTFKASPLFVLLKKKHWFYKI